MSGGPRFARGCSQIFRFSVAFVFPTGNFGSPLSAAAGCLTNKKAHGWRGGSRAVHALGVEKTPHTLSPEMLRFCIQRESAVFLSVAEDAFSKGACRGGQLSPPGGDRPALEMLTAVCLPSPKQSSPLWTGSVLASSQFFLAEEKGSPLRRRGMRRCTSPTLRTVAQVTLDAATPCSLRTSWSEIQDVSVGPGFLNGAKPRTDHQLGLLGTLQSLCPRIAFSITRAFTPPPCGCRRRRRL